MRLRITDRVSAYSYPMNVFERVKTTLDRSDADVFSIGESACGLPVLCAHCGGYNGAQLIVTAAIHARECYTALVALQQISEFDGDGGGGAYFVPLVNPDGALFFETGETFGKRFLADNLSRRREWKADADGIDLNCNFPARHGTGKYNTRVAGASDFIGDYPLCAPESAALARFTERVMPAATVSYHCMGGELYWEFFQCGRRRERDLRFATAIAERIGVRRVDGDLCSAGGYKDYCVSALGIPAVTVELIESGDHPFAPEHFAADIERNATLPRFLLDLIRTQ